MSYLVKDLKKLSKQYNNLRLGHNKENIGGDIVASTKLIMDFYDKFSDKYSGIDNSEIKRIGNGLKYFHDKANEALSEDSYFKMLTLLNDSSAKPIKGLPNGTRKTNLLEKLISTIDLN